MGITCSLVLYDVNNRRSATARGWITPQQGPQLRREELNDTINNIADNLGFYMKGLTQSDNRISITLSPKPRGIDQDSKLYMGYEDHSRFYKVRMWYEEKRMIDQLTRMLVTLAPYVKAESEVLINVVSLEGASLGVLSVDLPVILDLNLTDTDPDTVDSIRSVYKTDTIGETVTYIEKRGVPRLAGIGPTISKLEKKEA